MPLAQAQARDWLFYLHSTLWLLPEAGTHADQLAQLRWPRNRSRAGIMSN